MRRCGARPPPPFQVDAVTRADHPARERLGTGGDVRPLPSRQRGRLGGSTGRCDGEHDDAADVRQSRRPSGEPPAATAPSRLGCAIDRHRRRRAVATKLRHATKIGRIRPEGKSTGSGSISTRRPIRAETCAQAAASGNAPAGLCLSLQQTSQMLTGIDVAERRKAPVALLPGSTDRTGRGGLARPAATPAWLGGRTRRPARAPKVGTVRRRGARRRERQPAS
jgi:hypothetical protein